MRGHAALRPAANRSALACDRKRVARYGRLGLFGAVSYLDTQIEASPFAGAAGMDVPYAPEVDPESRNFLQLLRADQGGDRPQACFGLPGELNNDDILLRNNITAMIPAYTVVDLSARIHLLEGSAHGLRQT